MLKLSPLQLGFVHACVVHSYVLAVDGAVHEKLIETDSPGSSLSADVLAVSFICPEATVFVHCFNPGAVSVPNVKDVNPDGMLMVAEPSLIPGEFEESSVIVIVYV